MKIVYPTLRRISNEFLPIFKGEVRRGMGLSNGMDSKT
jgi:hypothetical protein